MRSKAIEKIVVDVRTRFCFYKYEKTFVIPHLNMNREKNVSTANK